MSWKFLQRNTSTGQLRTTDQGGGSSTLAGLSDVDVSGQSDGQVLKWDAENSKWVNADESGGVNDVKVNGTSVVSNKVARIKSYKEVTQSEYNALPDSKLTDGILYAIKDVGNANQFPPLIFSDEEREVGVWRDGKPLYQRTFRGTTSSSDNVVSVYSNSECDVINCEGNIEESADKIQIGAYLNSSYYCGWYFDKYDNNTLKIFYSNQYKGKDYVITIYYTKTTDTAGSGTWATKGGLAHHYSTSEQIVGTWIDGKPLYEKTITGAFTNGSTSLTLNMSSNMGIVINIRGFLIPSDTPTNRISLETKNDLAWISDFNSGNGNVAIRRGDSGYFGNTPSVYITAQYTKTTD